MRTDNMTRHSGIWLGFLDVVLFWSIFRPPFFTLQIWQPRSPSPPPLGYGTLVLLDPAGTNSRSTCLLISSLALSFSFLPPSLPPSLPSPSPQTAYFRSRLPPLLLLLLLLPCWPPFRAGNLSLLGHAGDGHITTWSMERAQADSRCCCCTRVVRPLINGRHHHHLCASTTTIKDDPWLFKAPLFYLVDIRHPFN